MFYVYNEQMTYKKKLFLIIGGIFVTAAVVIGIYTNTRPRPKESIKENKKAIIVSDVISYLKDGDIMLRQGDGPLSPMFRDISLTDKRFSHLGIVRIRDENITVINSVGYIRNRKRGVEEVSLENYLHVAYEIGVFRAKYAEGPTISDKAIEYVGRPFDWDFNLNDESKIYCTELLYATLKYVAPEHNVSTMYVDAVGKEIIPLDSISNSEDFDEILYIAN